MNCKFFKYSKGAKNILGQPENMTDENHNNENKIMLMKDLKLGILSYSINIWQMVKMSKFCEYLSEIEVERQKRTVIRRKQRKNRGQRWNGERSRRKRKEVKGCVERKEARRRVGDLEGREKS